MVWMPRSGMVYGVAELRGPRYAPKVNSCGTGYAAKGHQGLLELWCSDRSGQWRVGLSFWGQKPLHAARKARPMEISVGLDLGRGRQNVSEKDIQARSPRADPRRRRVDPCAQSSPDTTAALMGRGHAEAE